MNDRRLPAVQSLHHHFTCIETFLRIPGTLAHRYLQQKDGIRNSVESPIWGRGAMCARVQFSAWHPGTRRGAGRHVAPLVKQSSHPRASNNSFLSATVVSSQRPSSVGAASSLACVDPSEVVETGASSLACVDAGISVVGCAAGDGTDGQTNCSAHARSCGSHANRSKGLVSVV